jgi:hypothetical protein
MSDQTACIVQSKIYKEYVVHISITDVALMAVPFLSGMFQPDRVIIIYRKPPDKQHWHCGSAQVAGYKLKKDGTPGVHRARWSCDAYAGDNPAWLNELINDYHPDYAPELYQ